MSHPHSTRFRSHPRSALAVLARAARALLALLCRAWRSHRRLLLSNTAYTAALAAFAAALVTQSTLTDLASTLVAGVLALYRALRHDITPY